jgi:glycerol uptake facilitator protein
MCYPRPKPPVGPRLLDYVAGWGKLAFPGNYGQTTDYWWIPVCVPAFGAVAGMVLYDFFIGHVLDARATMLRTPEPGLAPLSTIDAAAGMAGPVTAEDSADGLEDPELEEDRAA